MPLSAAGMRSIGVLVVTRQGTKINVGVQNALDKDPPVNGRFTNVSVYGNGNTIPGTWDSLGRYYFFGVTQNF